MPGVLLIRFVVASGSLSRLGPSDASLGQWHDCFGSLSRVDHAEPVLEQAFGKIISCPDVLRAVCDEFAHERDDLSAISLDRGILYAHRHFLISDQTMRGHDVPTRCIGRTLPFQDLLSTFERSFVPLLGSFMLSALRPGIGKAIPDDGRITNNTWISFKGLIQVIQHRQHS